MEPFVLHAVRDVPTLDIQVGDRLILDPSGPFLLTRWRPAPVPNVGAALLALEEGHLASHDPIPLSVSSLRRVVGLADPLPDPGAPVSIDRAHLRLLP